MWSKITQIVYVDGSIGELVAPTVQSFIGLLVRCIATQNLDGAIFIEPGDGEGLGEGGHDRVSPLT